MVPAVQRSLCRVLLSKVCSEYLWLRFKVGSSTSLWTFRCIRNDRLYKQHEFLVERSFWRVAGRQKPAEVAKVPGKINQPPS